MAAKVKPIPDGFHSVSPYLVVHDGAKALEFYARAFGAQELFRMPGPGGKLIHAEMLLGDSRILISDEAPETGSQSPRTLKGSPVGLLVYTEDVDALHKRATDAGAKTKVPPSDMFWGDRWCAVVDPFGHEWQLATHKEDLSPEEMARRAEAAMR